MTTKGINGIIRATPSGLDESLARFSAHSFCFVGSRPCDGASPPLDDFGIELQGEAQGWLNSTCTYYDIGWLSEEQASKAPRRLMVLIKGDYLGEDLAIQAKKIALERSPGCQAIWPESDK